jgi:membrane fusion protein, multidrug efflux system
MELQPFFCREFSSRSISSFRPSASGWLHGPPFLRVCTSRTAVQHIGSSLSSGSRYSIFTLPEADLRLIQQQQQQQKSKAPLTVLAYTQDNTVRLDQGVPGLVNNEILQTTGSIQLKANFPNAAQRLWPGELVNARLLLGTRPDGLTVLASVVQQGAQGAYVYVINSDNSVAVRAVKVAQVSDGEALIDSGLSANEQVVEDGQYKLQTGTHVTILHGKAAEEAAAQTAQRAPIP